MDAPEGATGSLGGIEHAAMMLRAAADARKCWACGCLRHALDTIDNARTAPEGNDALDMALASARERLQPQRYECLGCDICFPAVALNDLAADGLLDLAETAVCPTDAVEERQGWPPLPGAYTVLRYHAPVAVCTLNDEALAETVAATKLPELAIVGTLHTENLGDRTLSRMWLPTLIFASSSCVVLIAAKRSAICRASRSWRSPRTAWMTVGGSLAPRASVQSCEI